MNKSVKAIRKKLLDIGQKAVRILLGKIVGLEKYRIVHRVKSQNLTYLSDQALYEIYDQVRQIEVSGRRGILIEAGCALGGSAIIIATAKSDSRLLNVYDVFDMIPEPSSKDGEDVQKRYKEIEEGKSKGLGGDIYYGYMDDLENIVVQNFAANGIDVSMDNVNLIKGRFEDKMDINEPVALAHIDGDWYSSVMTCLRRITPNLICGGVLLIDDYYEWSGCRRAVDEYFGELKDVDKHFVFREKARLQIMRIR